MLKLFHIGFLPLVDKDSWLRDQIHMYNQVIFKNRKKKSNSKQGVFRQLDRRIEN